MLQVREYAAVVARFFFIKDRRGVTAIEYGLIASLIALAIIGGVSMLGKNLSAVFSSIANSISS